MDHKLDLESQFILRLPQAQANALRQAIKTGEPLSKRLSVKFDQDIRHALVKFDNWSMTARLFDLPTIIESYKTLDRRNFYKTADVSQILICKEDPNGAANIESENEEEKKKYYDSLFDSVGGAGKREFLFPHGITPPLKNVRKRRFRKTLKKKYVDFSEIEKEVRRLFKFDCDAIESRFEIVEENKLDKIQPTQFSGDNAPSPLSDAVGMNSTENSQNIDLHELFGEECSSSDESDDDNDDDDKDDDIEIEPENDNDDDNMDDEEMEELPPEPTVPAADIAAEIAAASDLISQNDDSEEKRQELSRELAKIRDRIEIQENEMRGLDNQALMMRLQQVLDSLHEQENEIKKQLEEL